MGAEEIYKDLKLLDVTFAGSLFRACVLKTSEAQDHEKPLIDTAAIHIIVQQVLDTSLFKAYIHTKAKNEIVLLLATRQGDQQQFDAAIHGRMEEIYSLIAQSCRSSIMIGVGSVYQTIADLSKSYFEALQTINFSHFLEHPGGIHWYAEIPQDRALPYYPADMDLKLIAMVKNGNRTGTRSLLRDLLTENLMRRDLSPTMLDLLLSKLWYGIVLLVEQNFVHNQELAGQIHVLFERSHTDSQLQSLQNCLDLYDSICVNIEECRTVQAQSRANRMLNYIQENYAKPDLSLGILAEEFDITEAYLSQYFKEHTGGNFITYLQNMRIQKAVSLLTATDIPVKEISGMVGYSSYNTFSKAFRRMMGVNATDYRNNVKP